MSLEGSAARAARAGRLRLRRGTNRSAGGARRVLALCCLCAAAVLFSGDLAALAQQTPTSPQRGRQTLTPPSPRDQPTGDTSGARSRLQTRQPESSQRVNRSGGDARTGGGGGGATTVTGGGDAGGGADGASARPPGARQGRSGGAATRVVGSAGGGARVNRGGAGAVSVIGGAPADLFWQSQPVTYEPLPDEGEPMTIAGPMTLREFVDAVNFATNWNVLFTEAAKARQLDFTIVDMQPKTAVETILPFHGIYYRFDADANYLFLSTVDEYQVNEYAGVEELEIKVQHADVLYIESFISALLSSNGNLITDQRTSRIYIWDTPFNLEKIQETVEQLDVPLTEAEFTVRHADLADIEAVLNALLTQNGSLIADARTNQIFVWDLPKTIEQMREAYERLDVPVQSRTYDIQYVLAEDVLDAVEVLLSERGLIQVDPRTNTLKVTDLPERLDRIADSVASLDRELETRTWIIRYADLDFIADRIETYVPSEMGEIVVNEPAYQITVTGLSERLDKVDELIELWDVKRRQVEIQAWLVDLDDSVTRDLNVQWSYFINNSGAPIAIQSATGGFPGVNAGDLTVGQLPYAVPLFGSLELDDSGNISRPVLTDVDGNTLIDRFAGNNLAVALNYLDQNSNSRVLAAPRVAVQDGEEAIFENAERVPFASATTTVTNNNFGGNSTSRIEFVDVGLILRVRPRISEDNSILLDIRAEDSSADLVEIETFAGGTGGDTDVVTRLAPQVATRNVETQLRVHSGNTVVLGGLRQNRASEAINQTPILGELPLVGRLFQSPSRNSQEQTLMIFITPNIVDERTSPESKLLADTDAAIAEEHRFNRKGFWGRLQARITGGSGEIGVTIGQSGSIHSEGILVTLDDMRDAIFKAGREKTQPVTLIIREHPRAPERILSEIKEAAMLADVDFEVDDDFSPFVPSDRMQSIDLEREAALY